LGLRGPTRSAQQEAESQGGAGTGRTVDPRKSSIRDAPEVLPSSSICWPAYLLFAICSNLSWCFANWDQRCRHCCRLAVQRFEGSVCHGDVHEQCITPHGEGLGALSCAQPAQPAVRFLSGSAFSIVGSLNRFLPIAVPRSQTEQTERPCASWGRFFLWQVELRRC